MFFDLVLCIIIIIIIIIVIIISHLYASDLLFLTANCFDTDSTLRKLSGVRISVWY